MSIVNVNTFVENTLTGSEEISTSTGGRIYAFTVNQGIHVYPTIWWRVITNTTIADDISGAGTAYKCEVQIDVIARTPEVSSSLAETVKYLFNSVSNNSELGIISSYSNELIPAYTNEDETITSSVRVFINHI